MKAEFSAADFVDYLRNPNRNPRISHIYVGQSVELPDNTPNLPNVKLEFGHGLTIKDAPLPELKIWSVGDLYINHSQNIKSLTVNAGGLVDATNSKLVSLTGNFSTAYLYQCDEFTTFGEGTKIDEILLDTDLLPTLLQLKTPIKKVTVSNRPAQQTKLQQLAELSNALQQNTPAGLRFKNNEIPILLNYLKLLYLPQEELLTEYQGLEVATQIAQPHLPHAKALVQEIQADATHRLTKLALAKIKQGQRKRHTLCG